MRKTEGQKSRETVPLIQKIMLEQHFIKYKNPVLKLKGTVSQQSW
jgi:hypothetical protein